MRELAVLWMRQLWLYTLACQTRSRLVLSLKEHPHDFEEYKSVSLTPTSTHRSMPGKSFELASV